jgi:hypothetical protein
LAREIKVSWPVIIAVVSFLVFGVLVLVGSLQKHRADRRRYLNEARRFAREHGLTAEAVKLSGEDVALSGLLEGVLIKTSLKRIHVEKTESDEPGYLLEAYRIEVQADLGEWLATLVVETGEGERIEQPRLPTWLDKRFRTGHAEFDREYQIVADTAPAIPAFSDHALLQGLIDHGMWIARAESGVLEVYFKRPLIKKYTGFEKVERMLRLAVAMARAPDNPEHGKLEQIGPV